MEAREQRLRALRSLVTQINQLRHRDFSVPWQCKHAFDQERAEEAHQMSRMGTAVGEAHTFPRRFLREPSHGYQDQKYLKDQCPPLTLGSRCAVLMTGSITTDQMDVSGSKLRQPQAMLCTCARKPFLKRCSDRLFSNVYGYIDYAWTTCEVVSDSEASEVSEWMP